MDVEFSDERWDRLEVESNFTAGFAREIIRAYRKLMQVVRSAPDDKDVLRDEVASLRETQRQSGSLTLNATQR